MKKNDVKNTINEMSTEEALLLYEDLYNYYPAIKEKFEQLELEEFDSFSFSQKLEYVVTSSIILWARVYLGWTARDYQIPILEEIERARAVTLRLGRRLGKTDCMCVALLWLSHTQINKGPNNQYNILILTPYETQIDLIFDRLGQLIQDSYLLKSSIARNIHHRYELENGTIVAGLTVGASSGSKGGNNTRGQRADAIVLDEVDYMGSPQITNVLNIRNEAPDRIRIICASTPCGKREEYYEWCTNASRQYHCKQDDIDNLRFTGYNVIEKPKKEGNGWVEIWAPSIVNRELLKINPDTDQTYLEDLKESLTETRYNQEVLALFGDEEGGVYKKELVELAIKEGARIGHRYLNINDITAIREFNKNKKGPLILATDWDKIVECKQKHVFDILNYILDSPIVK